MTVSQDYITEIQLPRKGGAVNVQIRRVVSDAGDHCFVVRSRDQYGCTPLLAWEIEALVREIKN